MYGEDGIPAYDVGLECIRFVAGVKDSAFSEEREWRLVSTAETHYAALTRPRASGLVPYQDFLVNARLWPTPNPLPVVRIVVGPGHDQNAQIAAVRLLLHRRGRAWLDGIEVVASNVPFIQ